jgi:hypothetical protein
LRLDGGLKCSERSLGAIAVDSDVSFSLDALAAEDEVESEGASRLEVHLRYVGRDGGEYLAVCRRLFKVSPERPDLEGAMCPEVVAVSAVQRAACFAQGGSYRAARCELISTQRLLQRGMGAAMVQAAYLPFIVQAEKLDQFIREREAQELVGTRSEQRRRADRDDEAARAIYQMKSLSLARFREER